VWLIRYHGVAEALYDLPNDYDEIERLDELQHSMKALMGTNIIPRIVRSPSLIGNSNRLFAMLMMVVDLGTGSGLWAIEVADEYPDATVMGIDISPVQPTSVPENCCFVLENMLEGLSFHTDSVDLAHSRFVLIDVY
jgi:predicted RNA methylase